MEYWYQRVMQVTRSGASLTSQCWLASSEWYNAIPLTQPEMGMDDTAQNLTQSLDKGDLVALADRLIRLEIAQSEGPPPKSEKHTELLSDVLVLLLTMDMQTISCLIDESLSRRTQMTQGGMDPL